MRCPKCKFCSSCNFHFAGIASFFKCFAHFNAHYLPYVQFIKCFAFVGCCCCGCCFRWYISSSKMQHIWLFIHIDSNRFFKWCYICTYGERLDILSQSHQIWTFIILSTKNEPCNVLHTVYIRHSQFLVVWNFYSIWHHEIGIAKAFVVAYEINETIKF